MRNWDEMTELEQLACTYSDMHKDAYGFRPRHAGPQTVEQYREEMDQMQRVIEADIIREKEEQAAAIVAFEVRVRNTMKMCNCDRSRALDFIMDAEDCTGESWDMLCYQLGLPYGYFAKETA